MDLLDLIGKFAGVFVTTALGSGVGAYLGSYLKKKGENLATHEDIDKLIDQVAAVTTTTKKIEANISTEMWQRERKSDLQLKAIDSVNGLTSHFLQHSIHDPKYVPGLVDLSPKLRQTVKTHFSSNGELSHGSRTKEVHERV